MSCDNLGHADYGDIDNLINSLQSLINDAWTAWNYTNYTADSTYYYNFSNPSVWVPVVQNATNMMHDINVRAVAIETSQSPCPTTINSSQIYGLMNPLAARAGQNWAAGNGCLNTIPTFVAIRQDGPWTAQYYLGDMYNSIHTAESLLAILRANRDACACEIHEINGGN